MCNRGRRGFPSYPNRVPVGRGPTLRYTSDPTVSPLTPPRVHSGKRDVSLRRPNPVSSLVQRTSLRVGLDYSNVPDVSTCLSQSRFHSPDPSPGVHPPTSSPSLALVATSGCEVSGCEVRSSVTPVVCLEREVLPRRSPGTETGMRTIPTFPQHPCLRTGTTGV